MKKPAPEDTRSIVTVITLRMGPTASPARMSGRCLAAPDQTMSRRV